MDERDREIQRNGDIGQGERLVDAKARRQTRGGSLIVVRYFLNVSVSDHQFDIASYNIYVSHEQVPEVDELHWSSERYFQEVAGLLTIHDSTQNANLPQNRGL